MSFSVGRPQFAALQTSYPRTKSRGELDAALARSRYEQSQMAGNEKRGASRATAAVRDR
jgi:hypothetical protein